MNRKNILILDPEQDMSELFTRSLEARKDCRCYWTAKEEEAMALIKDIPFDLVIMDVSFATAGNYSLVRKVKRILPDLAIVIDAYIHQKEHASRAMEHGAAGYFLKPIKVEEFRKKIGHFLNTTVVQTP